MTDHVVYIGLGSNLQDPRQQLESAIIYLGNIQQSEIIQCSSFYKSRPMGPAEQPDYLNAVVSLKTKLEPLALLNELQAIEKTHGRVRDGQRWGPRTLDLDLLLFDQLILDNPRLIIPHPGLHKRTFVLYPLYEIIQEITIPGKGSLSDLIALCSEDDLEKID